MNDRNWIEHNYELINSRLYSAIHNFSFSYDFTDEVVNGVVPKIMRNFWDAIEYSLMGGKRIRGLLVIASVQAASGKTLDKRTLQTEIEKDFFNLVLDAAAAIESIHAFSLVHDDLPCMDDDELRRGLPSCHVKFGQPIALLVGDALQTMSMQILTSSKGFESRRLNLIKNLATATGANGMAGGQVVDIKVVGKKIKLADLEFMHSMKTGALFESAIEMGLIIADKKNRLEDCELKNFARFLGLAFQVVDDILDKTGKEEVLGKKIGRDHDLQKPNFVELMGITKAQKYADKLLSNALKSIEKVDTSADPLRTLAEKLTYREN